MALDSPRIVIVGAGGMGALFGAIFQDGGLSVTLYDTDQDHVHAICRDGLHISGYGGDRVVHLSATTDARSLPEADIVIFQCKSHGTRAGARAIKHLVDQGAVCVSFQNGLGNEEALALELGAANVLGGLTAMAGFKIKPGHIQDFSRVPSYIGELSNDPSEVTSGNESQRTRVIARALTNAGLETHVSDNITTAIWKKLLGNIAMSAVSGVTNLTSAQALCIPSLHETSVRALDEALAVADCCGIKLDRGAALDGMTLISQPGGTGDNKSSLCVDLLNKRLTEVEYIYGSVIQRADEHQVPVPTLKTLASLVRGMESHYSSSAD